MFACCGKRSDNLDIRGGGFNNQGGQEFAIIDPRKVQKLFIDTEERLQ